MFLSAINQGTDNGDGSWTLTTSQLNGLTVTPVDHTDFTLQVKVDNTDTDTETSAVDSNQTTALLTVTVDANIEGPVDPTVLTSSGEGNEDEAIAVNIGNVESIDPNEGVSSIVIGNVPDGAVFNAGNDNGNGTWTIPLADLDGLTITPAPHDSEDFT